MKKAALLLSLFMIVSCSNSDNSGSSSSSDFHPPKWIQGVWVQQSSVPGISGVTFSFTSNDFCNQTTTMKQCQQESVDQMKKGGAKVNVSETITDNMYTAEINYSGTSTIYSFKKLSDTKIEWTAVSGSQFIKQ